MSAIPAVIVHGQDDDTPFIQIRPGYPSTVTEGQEAPFRLVRSDSSELLWVDLWVSESEDMVADEDEGARRIVFDVGVGFRILKIATVDDDVREYDSTITVRVEYGEGYTVDPPEEATVTVKDDELGDRPSRGGGIKPARDTTVAEGDPAEFIVTRIPPLDQALEVTVAVSESGSMIGCPGGLTDPGGGGEGEVSDGGGGIGDVGDDQGGCPESEDGGDKGQGSQSGGEGEEIEGPRLCVGPECVVQFEVYASTTPLLVSTYDDLLDEPESVVTARVVAGADYPVGPLDRAEVIVVDNDPGARIDLVYLNAAPERHQRLVIVNRDGEPASYEMMAYQPEEGTRVEERNGGIAGEVPAYGAVVVDIADVLVISGRRQTTAGRLQVRAHPSRIQAAVIDVNGLGGSEEVTLYETRSDGDAASAPDPVIDDDPIIDDVPFF